MVRQPGAVRMTRGERAPLLRGGGRGAILLYLSQSFLASIAGRWVVGRSESQTEAPASVTPRVYRWRSKNLEHCLTDNQRPASSLFGAQRKSGRNVLMSILR